MLAPENTGLGAEQLALQRRSRPVALVRVVLLAPLGHGLGERRVLALVEALRTIAGVSIRHDMGLERNLAVGEAQARLGVNDLGVGAAHPAAFLLFPRRPARIPCASRPSPPYKRLVHLDERASGRLSARTNIERRLCRKIHADA